MKPMTFVRALYCLDSHYRPLRGSAARLRGCPPTAAGSRRFRAQHPALFRATGFSDHPYMRWYPPNREAQPDPDYSTLGEIRVLQRGLDRALRVYGSHRRYPIYNTEFGYITSPPKRRTRKDPYPWVRQSIAPYYLNWAEYLSWKNGRLVSFDQYLLTDPVRPRLSNSFGGFASGLLNWNGKPKPGYAAWRLPLYLPVTAAGRGRALEVWGCVRPAAYARLDTGQPQATEIQFQPHSRGPFRTLRTIAVTSPGGYFDVRLRFPGSGTVRLAWSYPADDPRLDPFGPLQVYSRSVKVSLR
jgi:hypothetical protein